MYNKFNNSKIFSIVFLLFILFLGCVNKKEEKKSLVYTIIDDLGREVRFEKEPEKVISLAPNITEILYEINCGEKIIGVTTYCDFPPEAQKKEKIGDLVSVNYEKIVQLNPDLIIITMEGNTKDVYDRLLNLKMNIFVSNPRNLNGILKTINALGKIFKKENNSDILCSSIIHKIDSVQLKFKESKKPSVFFIVSLVPLMSTGKNTFLNEIIDLSGGVNITADLQSNYPALNREEALKRDPDIILIPSDLIKDPLETLDVFPEWKIMRAVKNKKVFIVDANLTQRPGPRVGLCIEHISNIIH